jgi:hypothetical protein
MCFEYVKKVCPEVPGGKGNGSRYKKCPFTKKGCRECPIYRGRHCYIVLTDSQLSDSAIHGSNTNWIKAFNDFFDNKEETDFRKSIKDFFSADSDKENT